MTDVMAEDGLFDYKAPPAVSLQDRFGVPPFSILDRRAGYWKDRRDRWMSLGIQSEIGRGENLLNMSDAVREGYKTSSYAPAGTGRDMGLSRFGTTDETDFVVDRGTGWSGTSVFDPVLCELAYRWYTTPNMRILDPFAGGSVRGIVAAMLQRHYLGVDLRQEQVDADRVQGQTLLPASLAPWRPQWRAGDSAEVLQKAPSHSVDFVFSCPPYADLEVYSDDPRDLSTMQYQDFLAAHDAIVAHACRALKPDRFAAWVISDVRDRQGHYRGLVHDAVRSFEKAGLHAYNEAVVMDPVGSAAVRASRIFLGGRKLVRLHQVRGSIA
jgi:16S rRNA G966 N2-methylase RsmD